MAQLLVINHLLLRLSELTLHVVAVTRIGPRDMDKPTFNILTHEEHRPNQAGCVIVERDTTLCACTGLSAKTGKKMGHGELRRQCRGVHVCTAHGSAFASTQHNVILELYIHAKLH